jgi:hypothetical protein
MSITYTKLLRNLSYRYGIHTGKLMSLPANPKYRFTPSIHCTYPFKIDADGDIVVADWFMTLLFVYQNDGEVTYKQLTKFSSTPSNLEPLRANPNVFEWASDYKKNRGHYKLTDNAKEYIELVLGLIRSLDNMDSIKTVKLIRNPQTGGWVPKLVWEYVL